MVPVLCLFFALFYRDLRGYNKLLPDFVSPGLRGYNKLVPVFASPFYPDLRGYNKLVPGFSSSFFLQI